MTWALIDRYLRRALLGLRRDAPLHAGAAASLAAAFVLLGLFGLVLYNVSRSVHAWGDDLQLTAYLRDGATLEEARAVTQVARSLPGVARARSVSAEEAQRRLASPGSPGAAAFAGLPVDLFPASIELTLRADARRGAIATAVAERLKTLDAVEEVDSVPEQTARLENVTRLCGAGALVVLSVVLLGTLSIVSSTLLVTQHRRRDEIELLRLCGATDGFLRVPLLVEGAAQTLCGALLALLLLVALYLGLRGPAAPVLEALGIAPEFFPAWMIAAGLAGSALLGIAGSQISFRKSIRV